MRRHSGAVAPRRSAAPVEELRVSAYRFPTDRPESDGTLEWGSTTMVLVELSGGGREGLGFTYADAAAGAFVLEHLREAVLGRDALDIPRAWEAMRRQVRNAGRPGLASMAIAAVDCALWDLKARLLGLPLARLLGLARERVPIYGSGGFTSYPVGLLRERLGGWVAQGLRRVKMKVGREPAKDAARVRAAREAVGPDVELMADANGAYARKQALALADAFAAEEVAWLEEPVSSDDLEGLRLLRDRAPAGMEVAAGEYGYDDFYFRRMLEAGAVDVLQVDATRCAGPTGFLRAVALAEAFGVPVSTHTAPSIHLHLAAAVCGLRHVEYFHDHVRLEEAFFEGTRRPVDGFLAPDPGRPGLGLELKRRDAERYHVPVR